RKIMRKKIVAGNWKMNLTFPEAIQLHEEVEEHLENVNCDVYHFIPSIYLSTLVHQHDKIKVGAQNAFPQPLGAFTGEISMRQIQQLGVNAVLIGHSERRQIFGESNEFLKQKVDAALQEEVSVFFCCGETLEQREANIHED